MMKIYLIGGGGHCRSCIDVIEQVNGYTIEGIFDVKEKIGLEISGYKIIDTDENISKYASSDVWFLITAGQIKSPDLRIKLFNLNLNFATIISPLAYVSKNASIGQGTIVMHHALVNAGAKVGANCIINTKSLIEHDSSVGDHCHISTGAIINGSCTVGPGSFIGSNAVLKQGARIAERSIVGYGEKA